MRGSRRAADEFIFSRFTPLVFPSVNRRYGEREESKREPHGVKVTEADKSKEAEREAKK